MQHKARLLLAAVAVTASAGLALGAAAPLATASGSYVVDGSGDATNDWGDEGTLSTGKHSRSNATRLWQTVLYADGAKWKDSGGDLHTFTASDIDGIFGWKTRSATKYWQKAEGLEDIDGIVGKETFGQADGYLYGPYSDGEVTYTGAAYEVSFKRLDGEYYVKVGSKWKVAAYNWRS